MTRIRHWQPVLLLAGFLAAATSAFAQPAALPTDWPPNLRPSLFPEWIDAAKQIKWPPRDGCAEDAPVAATIEAGALIDRFGSEGGSFFSPVGQPFANRALPYVCSQMAYTTYRVKQSISVQRCAAAPWFGEPGGQANRVNETSHRNECGQEVVVPSGGLTTQPQRILGRGPSQ